MTEIKEIEKKFKDSFKIEKSDEGYKTYDVFFNGKYMGYILEEEAKQFKGKEFRYYSKLKVGLFH